MKGMMMFAQADATAAATAAQAAPAQIQAAPAQEQAQTTVQVPAGNDAPAAAPQAPARNGGLGMFVPMLVIFAIFYFMMIRPQQRKEKERRKMIEQLRAGAKVVFAQGLIGTIVEANERTFLIRTADGEVEVLRGAVSEVFPESTAGQASK